MRISDWSSDVCSSDLVYAAPGQITNIALEPGEQRTGAGPIAAGDTARWIIGDTTSGAGNTARVHILVKPTREDIETNLVINTDRRTYLVELRSGETPYMPSVVWSYPERPTARAPIAPTTPAIPPTAHRNRSEEHTSELQSLMRISNAV